MNEIIYMIDDVIENLEKNSTFRMTKKYHHNTNISYKKVKNEVKTSTHPRFDVFTIQLNLKVRKK